MRQTRAAIIAAFAQLLEERPLNKITVKDIVDTCDINRNTFYYHFQDIPALLQEMMDEKAALLIQQHYTFGRPLDCIQPALQYGKAHKQAILHVYRAVPRETFLTYLERLSQHMVDEYFCNISKELSIQAEDAHILSSYYKCTTVGCLLDWLDAGMDYDIKRIFFRVCVLLNGSGKRALLRARRMQAPEPTEGE